METSMRAPRFPRATLAQQKRSRVKVGGIKRDFRTQMPGLQPHSQPHRNFAKIQQILAKLANEDEHRLQKAG
jgi:hypothetical protein